MERTIMDELSRYVVRFYSEFMTEEEALAYRHVFGLGKIAYASSEKMKSRVREKLCTEDPRILGLLADGEDAFFERVRDRILSEHRDEVFLNYCPKCGDLARTPKSRQCKTCGNDWH